MDPFKLFETIWVILRKIEKQMEKKFKKFGNFRKLKKNIQPPVNGFSAGMSNLQSMCPFKKFETFWFSNILELPSENERKIVQTPENVFGNDVKAPFFCAWEDFEEI